jgi:hypothetical protein
MSIATNRLPFKYSFNLKSFKNTKMGVNTESLGYNPCLLAQFALDEKFNGLNPGATQSDVGMLRALTSDVNRGAVQFNVLPLKAAPTASSKVKLTASFLPFICDTSESEAPVDNCDVSGGDTPTYQYADFTVDEITTQKWTLSDDQFRASCETPGKQFDDMFLRNVDAFLRKVNKKSIIEASTFGGNYPSNGQNSVSNTISIPVIDPNKLYNPQAIALIKSEFMKMQLGNVNPIIVGAGLMDFAMAGMPIAGISDDGVNRGIGFGLENYFRDSQIDAIATDPVTGETPLLTWAPGALQLITWNKNVGPFAFSTPLDRIAAYDGIPAGTTRYKEQYVTLNIGGLEVDFFYQYDCNGNHSFALQLHHSVVGLPSTSFGACQDYNYVLSWLQTCGTLDCSLFGINTSPA